MTWQIEGSYITLRSVVTMSDPLLSSSSCSGLTLSISTDSPHPPPPPPLGRSESSPSETKYEIHILLRVKFNESWSVSILYMEYGYMDGRSELSPSETKYKIHILLRVKFSESWSVSLCGVQRDGFTILKAKFRSFIVHREVGCCSD